MTKRVLILDTSILCCWLNVPGKETAGPVDDRWTNERAATYLAEEVQQGSTFVLPIATLIETGNHIAQAPQQRFEIAQTLMECLRSARSATSPWAAFTEQAHLWDEQNLHVLIEHWPSLAGGGLTIGDATIKEVAEYYAQAGCSVEILTGDAGLKAYEPAKPLQRPRRRMGS